MPRTLKDSHAREIEEEERELGAPRVDELDIEAEEERATASLWDDKRASFADEDDEEPVIEDLDLDDLYAMEGPDA